MSAFALLLHKLVWTLASLPGLRFMTSLVYSKETIAYTRVEGAVAFTIDDGFCGLDNPEGCMLEEVRALFKEHEARATFFVAGSHCEHTSAEDVAALLADGHELANHNMRDHPYVSFTREEFAADLDETEAVLARYRTEAPAWYRAPFARMTKRMYEELDARGMKHILCDAFANDTAIPDPEWIARTVLSQCQPGSIALIHMPERGCREWNLEAMRLTLRGLKARDLEVITISELFARA
jgi:peptidoglycan/xylan/chitin deacetylase (PgdA/CDA1 family)